jgi:branched chain amino acid efflux pump
MLPGSMTQAVSRIRKQLVEPAPSSFRAGFRAGVPYAVAAFLLSLSFGVVARPTVGAGAAIVMSAVVFAGSAQFAATAVLAGGGEPLTAIIAGCLLNARFVMMGVAIAPSLRGGVLRRAAIGQTIIDFSWAASARAGGRFDPAFMVGATLPSYPAWVAGTVVGALGAGAIGDPDRLGLDAIFPAFFLTLLFGPEIRSARGAGIVAALGATIALVLVPITPAGVPVMCACAAALIGLWPPRERRTRA